MALAAKKRSITNDDTKKLPRIGRDGNALPRRTRAARAPETLRRNQKNTI